MFKNVVQVKHFAKLDTQRDKDYLYTVIKKEPGMLDKERKYFETHLAEWLKQHPGKFVLVKGDELVGVFDTQREALIEGARRFGIDGFLVRQVDESEQVIYIPALTLGILRADSTHPV
jgi:hypothetical protein